MSDEKDLQGFTISAATLSPASIMEHTNENGTKSNYRFFVPDASYIWCAIFGPVLVRQCVEIVLTTA